MTASFTVTELSGDRALINGTDVRGTAGEMVVNTRQWNEVKATERFKEADAEFNADVETFFAPLEAAAEKLEAAVNPPQVDDPAFTVLLEEGTSGVAAKPEVRLHLDKASVVLRLIEQSQFDRLIWINGELEVLALKAPVTP
jgi:hypothetical protein